MEKQDPNVNRGPSYKRRVDRTLDPEAMEAKRLELQAIDNKLAAREVKAKQERKAIQKEIADIKLQQQNCLAALNSGTVTEETMVRDWMYLQTGNVMTRREDNNDVVDQRPMTDSERQGEMFVETPSTAGAISSRKGKGKKASDGSSATVSELAEARAKKKGKGKPEDMN